MTAAEGLPGETGRNSLAGTACPLASMILISVKKVIIGGHHEQIICCVAAGGSVAPE